MAPARRHTGLGRLLERKQQELYASQTFAHDPNKTHTLINRLVYVMAKFSAVLPVKGSEAKLLKVHVWLRKCNYEQETQ